MKAKSLAIAASFLFIILAILYFIWLSPLMSDNFVFSREITPGYARFYDGAKVEARPLTLAGSIRQACEMYWTWCGRFAGNLAVYLLFMLPRWLYCLVAACGFGLYVWLLQMCVFGRNWRQNLTPGWILGLAALLWLGLPSFGEAFFWLSVGGEIALLGQAAILLPFRLALDGEYAPRGRLALFAACAAIFLGGICVASLDYPTSAALPVTALACVCWLWLKRRKFPAILSCGAIGLCVGGFLTLAAPGNAGRTLLTRDASVHAWAAASWPERVISWLGHLPGAIVMEWLPVFLLALACFALWRQYGKKWLGQVPPAAWLFLLPACLIHGAYLLTAWPPPRAFAGSFALLLVCACIVFAKAQIISRMDFRFLKILLALFCGLSLLWEGHKFWQLNQLVEKREEILHAAKSVAVIPAMPPGSGDRYWVLGKYLYDLSGDPRFWINRAMAAHYGLDEVRAEGGGTSAWQAPIKRSLIPVELKCANNVLEAVVRQDASKKPPDNLHIYYYGEPALLCALPYAAGEKILAWLAKGGSGIKSWLVPILLARADIALKNLPDGGLAGKSSPLKLYSDKMFWLARPGDGAASFDVFPFEHNAGP